VSQVLVIELKVRELTCFFRLHRDDAYVMILQVRRRQLTINVFSVVPLVDSGAGLARCEF
jgi:hypothetical protein